MPSQNNDPNAHLPRTMSSVAEDMYQPVLDDVNEQAIAFKAIRAGTAGNVRLTTRRGTVFNFPVLAGEIIYCRGTHVHSTGTTVAVADLVCYV